MNIPAEILARIEDEMERFSRNFHKVFFEKGAIFGYTLAQKELEEKDKEIADLKKEIELLKSVLNMHQESGRI